MFYRSSSLAEVLAALLDTEYRYVTGMPQDFNITRNMQEYYAFNWKKFTHSVHPETTAVLVETGFLSNAIDQHFLLHYPDIAARGLANGITAYFNTSVSALSQPTSE